MRQADKELLMKACLCLAFGALGLGSFLRDLCQIPELQIRIFHGFHESAAEALPHEGYVICTLVALGVLTSLCSAFACFAKRRHSVPFVLAFSKAGILQVVFLILVLDIPLTLSLGLFDGLLGFPAPRVPLGFVSQYLFIFALSLWLCLHCWLWRSGLGAPRQDNQEAAIERDEEKGVSSDVSPSNDPWLRYVYIACGIYILFFGVMGVLQCRALSVSHIDSVIFERIFWNTLHGRFGMIDTGINYSAEHVSLTIYLLLPLYVLWPSIEMLSLFQTVAIGIGGIPAYLIAREIIRKRHFAFCFALAYLLSPALHYSNSQIRDTIFDTNALSATLILWSFYGALRKKWWLYFVMGALALWTREDVSVSVFMMGLYIAVIRRDWKPGLGGAAMGIGWLGLCLTVIIPSVRADLGQHDHPHVFMYFAQMGNEMGMEEGEELGVGHMIKYVLTEPKGMMRRLTSHRDIQFFLDLALPFGLLALLAPEALLMAVPAFALSMLADERWEPNVSIMFWYHIVHIPLVFIASVMGASKAPVLLKWLQSRSQKLSALKVTPADLNRALGILVVCCSFVMSVMISKWPLTVAFWDSADFYRHYSKYQSPEETQWVPEIQALIPQSESVVATRYLTHRFSHHPDVFRFPARIADVNWVVVNRNDRSFHRYTFHGIDFSGDMSAIRSLQESDDFVIAYEKGPLIVFKRRSD
jgi:uncharacterized membrane protein